MDALWILIRSFTVVCIVAGLAYWFLIPREWIVRSKLLAKLLSEGAPPPWRSLNKLGKLLFIVFCISGSFIIVALFVGLILESTQ